MKNMFLIAVVAAWAAVGMTGCASHRHHGANCDGSCCKDAASCAKCCQNAEGCAKCCKK